MWTRRELLWALAAAPLAAHSAGTAREPWCFLREQHLLAEESASGFASLLRARRGAGAARKLIIAPGIRDLSRQGFRELRGEAEAGAWVIFEAGICFSSAEAAARQKVLLKDTFDLDVLAPAAMDAALTYVRYEWPVRRLVRPFASVTPLRCRPAEIVATLGSKAVCARRTCGRGGIVYLGSMLGPNLRAEEREAQAIGQALLKHLSRPCCSLDA